MGIAAWDLGGRFVSPLPVRTPRLTIRCEYPDTLLEPTEVSFSLSRSYGLHTAREAHDWFLQMMQEHEEFEVETDEPWEWPMPSVGEAGGGGVRPRRPQVFGGQNGSTWME